MHVRLTYQSGQQYSESFSHFDVKVTRRAGRVKISFEEKGAGSGHSSFSLPQDRAQQLAYGILLASSGAVEPIQFNVEEPPVKAVAA